VTQLLYHLFFLPSYNLKVNKKRKRNANILRTEIVKRQYYKEFLGTRKVVGDDVVGMTTICLTHDDKASVTKAITKRSIKLL
jgi:hypothetical protein